MGMGHGVLDIGHGVLGIGHGVLGVGHGVNYRLLSQPPTPNP